MEVDTGFVVFLLPMTTLTAAGTKSTCETRQDSGRSTTNATPRHAGVIAVLYTQYTYTSDNNRNETHST